MALADAGISTSAALALERHGVLTIEQPREAELG